MSRSEPRLPLEPLVTLSDAQGLGRRVQPKADADDHLHKTGWAREHLTLWQRE